MNLVWDHWHIEASSKCALRCPRCPRAELSGSLLSQQLSLECQTKCTKERLLDPNHTTEW